LWQADRLVEQRAGQPFRPEHAGPFVDPAALVRDFCSGASRRVFPHDVALGRKPAAPSSEHRSNDARLSPREKEILSHLVAGHSNKLIARHLGIAEATVKVHLKSVQRKIRVENRTQAAIWALANLPELNANPSLREAARPNSILHLAASSERPSALRVS
jgi:DNA-binding CsgD family transcriptional regulator